MLKFGSLPKMNDFMERTKNIYVSHYGDMDCWRCIPKIEERLKSVKQISLSLDDKYRKGYAINAMWGHYAKAGEGCCIVVNKELVIKQCKKMGYLYAPVYYNGRPSDIIYNPKQYSMDKYLEENKQDLFFRKSSDWKYEQKFRIINLKANPDVKAFEGLNLTNAIECIVLHTNKKIGAFGLEKVKGLMKCYPEFPFLEYSSTYLWGEMLIDINGEDFEL
jgi:hypothetical protein